MSATKDVFVKWDKERIVCLIWSPLHCLFSCRVGKQDSKDWMLPWHTGDIVIISAIVANIIISAYRLVLWLTCSTSKVHFTLIYWFSNRDCNIGRLCFFPCLVECCYRDFGEVIDCGQRHINANISCFLSERRDKNISFFLDSTCWANILRR